jgi:single-strand DNA-binding protein
MSTINKVILLGNVGNVEVKTFDGGGKIVNINLATSESYKKGDEYVDKTEWHRCVFSMPSIIERAEKINKGDKIYVEGTIQTKTWTSKEGENKESKDIFCVSLKVMSRKDKNASTEQNSSPAPAPAPASSQALDDLF